LDRPFIIEPGHMLGFLQCGEETHEEEIYGRANNQGLAGSRRS